MLVTICITHEDHEFSLPTKMINFSGMDKPYHSCQVWEEELMFFFLQIRYFVYKTNKTLACHLAWSILQDLKILKVFFHLDPGAIVIICSITDNSGGSFCLDEVKILFSL